MANEWKNCSLGDLFKVKHGFAFKGEYFTDEPQNTVLVTPGNFAIGGGFQDGKRKYYSGPVPEDYVLNPGQVVVTMTDLSKESDTLGYAASVPDDSITWLHNQRVGLLEFKAAIPTSPRFVQYLLRTHEYRSWVVGSATGTTVKHTSPGRIESFTTRIPSIEEQRAIAHILGALDDKIELNRRMNATLEAMARALFKAWFVDFEPVRAKMEGRWQRGQSLPGLPAHLYDLFPNSFQESELGHIPAGWVVKTIDELAERVAMGPFGSDIKVSTFVPEGIPVISGQHLRGILLDDSEFNFVTEEHADRLKRSNVQRGDVIFTHAGSIGQVAYIPEASRYERYIVSQRQFYMRCNRALVSPYYITSYFKTHDGQHRLLANTSSTGVPSISQPVTYLRQLKMVVPPPVLLNIFDETVGKIHLSMADNDHQSRSLAQLRDTLLPKLISGELRVPDAERNVEDQGESA